MPRPIISPPAPHYVLLQEALKTLQSVPTVDGEEKLWYIK